MGAHRGRVLTHSLALAKPGVPWNQTVYDAGMPKISVVIPLLNEEENVAPLVRECSETLDQAGTDYEIILVDDGSTDGTYEQIRKAAQNRPSVSAIRLRRNFGQRPPNVNAERR